MQRAGCGRVREGAGGRSFAGEGSAAGGKTRSPPLQHCWSFDAQHGASFPARVNDDKAPWVLARQACPRQPLASPSHPALRLHSGCPAARDVAPAPASLHLTTLQLSARYPPRLRNRPWLASALGSLPALRLPWPAHVSRESSFLWQESVAVAARLPPAPSARERGLPRGMQWKRDIFVE